MFPNDTLLDINTHPVGLLSTSDHSFPEAAYVYNSKQTKEY